jgi:DNA-binding CsgD family transcriptional regulator
MLNGLALAGIEALKKVHYLIVAGRRQGRPANLSFDTLTGLNMRFKLAARAAAEEARITGQLSLHAMPKIRFTDSELKVIALRVNGVKPDQIATLLGFKRRKVNDIVSNVYRKTGVNSVVKLTLWAIENGLDQVPKAD